MIQNSDANWTYQIAVEVKEWAVAGTGRGMEVKGGPALGMAVEVKGRPWLAQRRGPWRRWPWRWQAAASSLWRWRRGPWLAQSRGGGGGS
jgi:hypothetical protein